MAVKMTCSGCGKTYNLADQYIGKKVRCTNCQYVNVVPEKKGDSDAVPPQRPERSSSRIEPGPGSAPTRGKPDRQSNILSATSVPIPVAQAVPTSDEDIPLLQAVMDDEEDIRPRRKKRSELGSHAKSNKTGFVLAMVGIAVLVLAVGGIVAGIVITKMVASTWEKVDEEQKKIAYQAEAEQMRVRESLRLEAERRKQFEQLQEEMKKTREQWAGPGINARPQGDNPMAGQNRPRTQTSPFKNDKPTAPSSRAMPLPGQPLSEAELDAALANLKDPRKRGRALMQLKDAAPVERREEVASMLAAIAKNPANDVELIWSLDALGKWGNREHVPLMIARLKHKNRGVRWSALKALAPMRDERAVEPAVKLLNLQGDRDMVVDILQGLGPSRDTEKLVLPYLDTTDIWQLRAVCKALQYVGTKESLSALQQVSKSSDVFVSRAALEAIQAINQRN